MYNNNTEYNNTAEANSACIFTPCRLVSAPTWLRLLYNTKYTIQKILNNI